MPLVASIGVSVRFFDPCRICFPEYECDKKNGADPHLNAGLSLLCWNVPYVLQTPCFYLKFPFLKPKRILPFVSIRQGIPFSIRVTVMGETPAFRASSVLLIIRDSRFSFKRFFLISDGNAVY